MVWHESMAVDWRSVADVEEGEENQSEETASGGASEASKQNSSSKSR